MSEYDVKDTIIALSTPLAKSALAVVRMTGKDAINIAKKICFNAVTDKKINEFEHRKSYYVNIRDKNNVIIDELVVLTMLSPNTFTSEDTVEFFPHGSIVIIEALLELAVSYGARLALKGEFTYRAYINGRLSISEAEAIHDVIESKNRLMSEASIHKMKGRLNRSIDTLKEYVKDILILVEGEIDFPEDDTVPFSYNILIENLKSLRNKIDSILESSKTVQKIIHGVKIAILGKVNVGKSSIFNMLVESNRAIVSNIAGTTRDFIHEVFYVDSIPFYIMDTAGFHAEASNEIEIEGIKRSKECALECDIILAVFDKSTSIEKDDLFLIDYLATLQNKNIMYVLNKSDSENNFDTSKLQNFISLSTKTLQGKNEMVDSFRALFKQSDMEVFNKESYVNLREKGYLELAITIIDECIKKSEDNYMLDNVAEDIRTLNNTLFNINGKIEANDVIDEIFSKFCIGK